MKKPVLMALLLLVFSAILMGQSEILDRTVSIENKVGTIGSLLEEIQRNGDFFFTYGQDIPQNKKFRLRNNRQTVQQYLDEIFNRNIYCVEIGKNLLIKPKPELLDIYTVRGRVVNSKNGEPVPGATVFIPGSDPLIGAASDNNGLFQIDVPREMDFIQFSCIGYHSLQLETGHSIPGTIDLRPMKLEISEAMIVKYKKPFNVESNVAISYVSGERLERLPVTNIEHALQGSTSGILVVNNSGMPGSTTQVKMRGNHSLINSDPIYYLDGIPIQQTSLKTISMYDIETVEIVKDATGTARYGAFAGNGAVLLHSKNGNNEKIRADLNYYIGMQKAWRSLDLMDGDQYREYRELVLPRDPLFDQMYTSNVSNWTDTIFHPAKTEDIHFSVYGGNEYSDYYIGSGYFNQSAIINKLVFRRYSFKLRSNHKISSKLHLGHSLNFAHLNYEGLKEGCFLNDMNNPILSTMCNIPFSLINDSLASGIRQTISYADQELTNNERKNYIVNGNISTVLNISPAFSYESIFGYEVGYQNNVSCNRVRPVYYPDSLNPVLENVYHVKDLAFQWQNLLHYSATLAEQHEVHATFGFEYGQGVNEWIPIEQRNSNLLSTRYSSYTPTSNEVYRSFRSAVDFRHQAILGTLEYTFRERYLFQGSLRRDVTGFDDSDQEQTRLTGYYPSVSMGWIFWDRKQAASGLGILEFGKIKYAYGKAGNSPRLDYTFHSKIMRDMSYVYSFFSTGRITTSAHQRLTNERYYMEEISAQNLGLDVGLLRNRLSISTSLFLNHLHKGNTYRYDGPFELLQHLYGKNNYGILPLPVAEIVNSGIEGEIMYKQAGRLINLDLSLHLTHLRNRIINIDKETYSSIHRGNIDPISVNLPGEAAGSFYGYKRERLFGEEDCPSPGETVTNQPYIINSDGEKQYAQPDAHAGDYKFVDINKDSVIDKYDKTVIGNPYPDYAFGFYAYVQYKQFDFSMFWQGTYGNEIYNATKLWLYNPYGSSNWSTEVLNSYLAPRYNESGELIHPGYTDTDLHRVDYYARNKNLRVSDFYIEDGSYLRLKNIQLGYTMDPVLTRKIFIQKFRIYISAQNLLTLTGYSGLDPEVGGWGIDCGIYPQPRIWIVGVNVEF